MDRLESVPASANFSMNIPSATLIILNWNGRDLLAQGLPSVSEAVRRSRFSAKILVVDNGSIDDSVAFVRAQFPAVEVLPLESNFGFGEGNNIGARHATSDVIMFLNNDMVVEPDFLDPLLEPFEQDDRLFAVGSQIFFQDKSRRREETGKTFAYWDHGTIRYLHQEITPLDAERGYVPIFWASGGSAAYSREKFLLLGGFRSMYSPAYVEDSDLSYRAMRRGWKNLCAPASIVYHKHRASSTRRFTPERLETLVKRNHLLFIWSNVSDPGLLLEHFVTLPIRVLKRALVNADKTDAKALLAALPFLFKALASNLRERRHRVQKDEDFLCSHRWRNAYLASLRTLQILFVCPYVPCLGVHAGGGRMYQVIKGLSQRHKVSVLTYYERESEQPLLDALREFCVNVTAIKRHQSLDEPDWFHILPYRPVKEFCNPAMKDILARESLSGKYDIIQFEYLELAQLARSISLFNVPSLLTQHEVQSRMLAQRIKRGSLSFLEKLQVRFEWMKMLHYELRISKEFDCVVAMTEDERLALHRYDPDVPIRVNHTGVDVAYFSSFRDTEVERHSMVFVAYYRHLPNSDAMEYFCSRIFPRIRERYPDAKMYIVGAQPSASVQRLHDGNSVIVTGRVDDIRPSMARAEVYVVPIRLGAGIRGKILEAWSMKKPVVATSIAASGLMARSGENIVVCDDAEDFALEICRIFADPELGRRLGESGFRTAAEHYDWPGQIERLEEMYYDVLRNSQGRGK